MGLKLLPESEKRRVELTPAQARQLISILPSSIDAITEFAIYSGFRKENILSLKIESINFHALTDSADVELLIKGGRRERFPLGKHSVRILKQIIGNRQSGYIFLNPGTGGRYTTISKTFDRAVRKLNLTVNGTKLRLHDLRHVFCTWLLREGVNIEVIRELAGHRSRQTTDRYVSLNRMEVGKYFSVLPDIRNLDNKSAEAV